MLAERGARARPLAVGLLLLGAATQVLAAPPHSMLPLHLIAAAPAFVVLSRAGRGQGALLGWLWGIAANAAIFHWLVRTVDRFTSLSFVGGVVALGLFAAAFGFYGAVFGWGARAVRERAGPLWPLALAALFTGCELLNPQLFPYHQGSTWYQVPSVFLVSALVGVPGVTFLLLAVNGLVAAAAEGVWGLAPRAEVARTLRVSGAVLALLLAGSVGYSTQRAEAVQALMAAGPTLRVGLVQTGRSEEEARAARRRERDAEQHDLLALSAEARAGDPGIDVFVWPEGALRADPNGARAAPVRAFAAEQGVGIWTGAVLRGGPREARIQRNQVVRIEPDGSVSEPYDKNILVPFGEFLPLGRFLPFLAGIRAFPHVVPGTAPRRLEGAEGPSIGPLVCYEAIQASYVRGVARTEPDLLVTVTFDGWFGDTAALDQHMMLAASMSAMLGIPMVRAATTGISMATGADGVLLGQSHRDERGVLVLDVPLAHAPSLNLRLADAFGWLCAWVGLALASAFRGERRPRHGIPALLVIAAPLPFLIDPSTPALDWIAVLGCAVLLGVSVGRAQRGP